jgi:hypothetical protein
MLGDMNYRVEWMPIAVALGLVTLLFVPVLGLLVGFAILLLALAAVMALAAAAIAAPFLVIRSVRRRWRDRMTNTPEEGAKVTYQVETGPAATGVNQIA